MRTSHSHGLDILGASGAPAPAAVPNPASQLGKMFLPSKTKKRALLIQINNAAQLAAKEKGEEGVFAANVLPDIVEQQVYQIAGDKIDTAMRAMGVDANVKVIDVGSWTLDEDDLGAAKYTAMGFVGASAIGLLGYFWLRKK